jgi:DNA (cytosine-5)-methyltransferase 1
MEGSLQLQSAFPPGQKLCNVRASERAVPTWSIPEVFGRTTKIERDVLSVLVRLRRRARLRDFGDADPVDSARLSDELGLNIAPQLTRLVEKNYLKRVGHLVDFKHTFNGKYRRLRWDHPSSTADTSFGTARSFLHPSQHRALTLREAARIQGFPDSFRFFGAVSDQFRMIGKPPLLPHRLCPLQQ